MNTQHTKMAGLGAGVLLLALGLQSFAAGDDKGKMKRYEVIHHANGQTMEYDTLIPMSSSYTVEQFLADKGIVSDNVKIIQMPALPELGMLIMHEEKGAGEHVIVHQRHHGEDLQWDAAEGQEVKVICEMGPDGKMLTRKFVDGEEVEMGEVEIHALEEKAGHPGEHRMLVRTRSGENPTEEQQMDVKIKCEIDEQGTLHARKWVNGEEVELSEQELSELQMPHDGQKVIIRMEHENEGGAPSEEQIIEIERILEELGAGEENGQPMILIEKEIENGEGVQRHVIHVEGDEGLQWKEGTHKEVRMVSSDEEEFTMVMVTENIQSEQPHAAHATRTEMAGDMHVYPNPTAGKVTIAFTNSEKVKTSVEIADMQGKVVFQEDLGKYAGSWSKEVDLNRFGKGTYVLSVQQGKRVLNEKIIVE